MSATGGRRRAEPAARPSGPLATFAATICGSVLGAVTWVLLVRAAIDFGSSARSGRTEAWTFLAVATLGAVLCLVLVLVLAGRGIAALRTGRALAVAAGPGRGKRRR